MSGTRTRLAVLGVSALALSFAFAPFPLRFLAPLTLVPLFWIIETSEPKQVFRYGLFFGAMFFMFHLWWLYGLVVPVQPVTRVLLDVGVTLLFVYLGLCVALFALATKHLGLYWSPFIWAAMEWLRSRSDLGFPWGLLGASLTPYTPMIQGASIVGVYGMSALVVWIGLMCYKTLRRGRKEKGDGRNQGRMQNADRRMQNAERPEVLGLECNDSVVASHAMSETLHSKLCSMFVRVLGFILYPLSLSQVRFGLLLVVSIAGPLVFGLVRMRPNQKWFRVGIVQPNVSPYTKGLAATLEQDWRDLLRLSRNAIDCGARVLIYPETATLSDVTQGGRFADSLHALSDSNGVMIVTGTPLFRSTGYMNATVVIEPGQPVSEPYIKIHPAPFSEHFPFSDKLPFLRKIMTVDMGEEISGVEYRVFDVAGHKFSTAICFEGIFPELVWQFARRGAEVLVVVTNDGWFGKTPGPYQHCELMIMRAVENGIPLVRSANNGISLVADSYGRVLAQTGLFTQTNLVQDVPQPLASTFYRRNGDQFSYLALVIVGLLIVVRLLRAVLTRRTR